MKVFKILLTMAITMACGNNVKAHSDQKKICDLMKTKVHLLYCMLNDFFNPTCYNDDLNVKFYFYEKESNGQPKKQLVDVNTRFNLDKRTTIIIHGFLNNGNTTWINSMVTELQNWQEDMNILVVEWFKNIVYSTAAAAVDDVATQTAIKVQELFENSIKKPKYIHIIGHSLGVHIAGLTASKLKDIWFVDRVTGLDPAKPFFDEEKNKALKLNKDCADFVDVIHTNAGQNEATFGLYGPLGHIDFYPNKGDYQPSCDHSYQGRSFEETYKCVNKITITNTGPELASNLLYRFLSKRNNMICDHGTATTYFTESFRNRENFFAVSLKSFSSMPEKEKNELECNIKNHCETDESNCAEMGIFAEKYANNRGGAYFLKTNCGSDEQNKSWYSFILPWSKFV